MLTIGQLRDEIKALVAKVDTIHTQATGQNRDLTPEEIAYENEVAEQIEKTEREIQARERTDRIKARLEGPANPPVTKPAPSGIVVVQNKEKFGSLGQQLAAVVRAGSPGGNVDPRLFTAAAASGMNETVPSDGGFLVQQEFANILLEETIKTGILAPKCRQQPISGNANGIKINGVDETSRVSSRFGGIVGYWASEAEEKTKSKPKFRQIELSLKKLIGLCYATDELLQDAVALEAFIRQAFPSEFGFLVDDAIVNGTGAGQPLGILNAGSLVTVAKEAGQVADTILAENVIKMSSRLFASSFPNAAWYVNQMCMPQLYTMSIAVGTGGQLVFIPPGGLSAAPYGMLLGRPVIPIEQCAALGDVGDIILADLNGYILAQKGGIQSDMSIHVRFVYDESVFRFVLRIDGQPVRASALTPYKGGATATQSHFVALAAR